MRQVMGCGICFDFDVNYTFYTSNALKGLKAKLFAICSCSVAESGGVGHFPKSYTMDNRTAEIRRYSDREIELCCPDANIFGRLQAIGYRHKHHHQQHIRLSSAILQQLPNNNAYIYKATSRQPIAASCPLLANPQERNDEKGVWKMEAKSVGDK